MPLHGNHDGYRADAALTSGIGYENYLCKSGWISRPGVWFEHCHRWDEFNRDGMAFGAAVTNYVYYFPRLISGTVSGLQSFFAPQRQASFMPGAALWFALANHRDKHKNFVKDEGGKPMELSLSGEKAVHPFGVYVIGHTHDPDLAYMAFRQDDWTVAKKKADDLEKYLEKKAKRAMDESAKTIKKTVQDAIKAFKDGKNSIEETIDEIRSWPYRALYEAERAIEHLYGIDRFY